MGLVMKSLRKRCLEVSIFLLFTGMFVFPGLALCTVAPDNLQRRLARERSLSPPKKILEPPWLAPR